MDNLFDSMPGLPNAEVLARQKQENELLFGKLDKLIHQTFAQNEAGKELLELWKEALVMTPTVTAHSTEFQAGIEEGKKTFIRQIYLTIKSIEGA